MIYAVVGLVLLGLMMLPQWWVQYVLKKHHRLMDGLPGTGGELADHLVERFALDGVSVEMGTANQDHYNPAKKLVSLSPEVYQGKSLTAVAVAAHEVGHAIQFSRDEPVSRLRGRYLGLAHLAQRAGIFILMAIPLVTLIFRVPHVTLLTAVIGVLTMLASVLVYVVILPEEYDASFNKALPILREGYIAERDFSAVEQVLRACVYTYVAAALADVLRLWRWLPLLR